MRRLVMVVMALLSAWSAAAATIEGVWTGTLAVGEAKLRVVFAVERQGDGWTAKMSSPDQGAMDIPVDRVSLDGTTVTFVITAVRGDYSGMLRGEEIDGQWKQPSVTLPLVLKRGVSSAAHRPQEPASPFPYDATDECWKSAHNLELCGTLTAPRGQTRGAVVLLAGSGPLDRDGSAFGHRPLLVIADRLARSGFASLRFDHRGVGRSKGTYDATTTFDRVADAASALALLRSRVKGVPSGVVGHSEGALVASLLAADDPTVALLVLLNGPGLTGRELMLMRAERLARKAGVAESDIARDRVLRTRAFESTDERSVRAAINEELSKMSESGRKALGYSAAGIEELVAFHGANRKWLSEYLTLDPAAAMARVRAPTLIVAGDRDVQVPADANAYALAAARRCGGSTSVDVVVLPSINHVLQTSKSGMPSEYPSIDETVADSVLETVLTWMKRVIS